MNTGELNSIEINFIIPDVACTLEIYHIDSNLMDDMGACKHFGLIASVLSLSNVTYVVRRTKVIIKTTVNRC